MIIHVKPDKNHNPTYIYEDDRKHPDLPPGAITVGDLFSFIGKFLVFLFKLIPTIALILVIMSVFHASDSITGQQQPRTVIQYNIHR